MVYTDGENKVCNSSSILLQQAELLLFFLEALYHQQERLVVYASAGTMYAPPAPPRKKKVSPTLSRIVPKMATLSSVATQNAARSTALDGFAKKRKELAPSIEPRTNKKLKIEVSVEEQNPTLPEVVDTDSTTQKEQTILVDTLEGCVKAMREIQEYKVLAVDCEGVNLGREGELCLVQIGLGEQRVFLIDILAGGKAFFEEGGLRAVLEDPERIKILHDCRSDSDALYHQYGVSLAGIFDTQVAFCVMKRQMNQPTPLPVSLNTLLRLYATPLLEAKAPVRKEDAPTSQKLDFFDGKKAYDREKELEEAKKKVDTPSPVKDAATRRNAANIYKEQARKEMQENENYWRIRPMTPLMQGYASEDVLYLTLVYKQIDALLHDQTRRLVYELSAKYVAQVRDLQDIKERQTYVDGVPKYGFSLWDNETAMSLNIMKNRPRRRRD